MKNQRKLRCCRTNHATEAGVLLRHPDIQVRGTVIAGWSVYSNFRACATKFGLNFNLLVKLNELAAEYETKYDVLAIKIGFLRKKFSHDELTLEESNNLIKKIGLLATEADALFIEYAYKGREIIPDDVWEKYEAWLDKIAAEKKLKY